LKTLLKFSVKRADDPCSSIRRFEISIVVWQNLHKSP
jgi:hypothetical protein